jgi:hypothetical protein
MNSLEETNGKLKTCGKRGTAMPERIRNELKSKNSEVGCRNE